MFPGNLLDKFQIICSRVRSIDPNKKSILWLHDTWDDPESRHLSNASLRSRFTKLIFVSYYQFWTYHLKHGVSYDESVVLRNAIEPIPDHKKNNDVCRLIYHTTPHRGLEILVPVFEKLYDLYGNKIHLDVYSSFKLYNWAEKDKPYYELFDRCQRHPGITYHGAVDNDTVRKALQRSHIMAYPSIWPETSGISVIEAMSAKNLIVCPSFGALPETTSNFSVMYPYTENVNIHATRFYHSLVQAIENYASNSTQNMLSYQQSYVNSFYSWNVRAEQWKMLLNGLLKSA